MGNRDISQVGRDGHVWDCSRCTCYDVQVIVRRFPRCLLAMVVMYWPVLVLAVTPLPVRSECGRPSLAGAQRYVSCMHSYIIVYSSVCYPKVLTFHRYAVSCMAYSRDDRFLLSVGKITLLIWT